LWNHSLPLCCQNRRFDKLIIWQNGMVKRLCLT
jgi:hypothetical protein